MDVTINGVNKGKIGAAGELKGSFNTKKIGSLTMNSSSGVFGIIALDKVDPPEEALIFGLHWITDRRKSLLYAYRI